MPVLDNWDLKLNTDEALRAQGMDPDVIRERRPKLINATEVALAMGKSLLEPKVLFENYGVNSLVHDRLVLDPRNTSQGKNNLSGPLIAQHLSRAKEIIVMLCTIGSNLDSHVSRLFADDPMVALALDGVGSAAVESLAIQACNYFEQQAKINGFKTTMPLNPGMVGWPVEVGQPQIFSLLDCEEIGVTLTDSWMMVPNKSLSLVLGIGTEVSGVGSSCEYCSLKGVCKYQNHYAK